MLFEINTHIRNDSICEDDSLKDIFPVLDANNLDYSVFFQNYLLPNKPCIIKRIADNWESHQLWHSENKINYEYLDKKYGALKVTVYNCLKRYYNCHQTYDTTFTQYLDYFQHSQFYKDRLDYLKNWHLKLNTGDSFYEVPVFFASDWLNEYYISCVKSDDYRFVYMGPKNTWTPLHSDVFSSYSWSVNVCGKKKWIFFPPGEEQFLKDNLGNLPYDMDQENISSKHFEVIQEQGEAVFVPSGWHHQVWNLEDTISINHNWVNGCNINSMFDSLISNFTAVEREIEDCKDIDNYSEHCQIMLNAVFGVDFYKFYDFVKYVGLSRINIIEGVASKTLFHGHKIGDNHVLFDLEAVQNVLKLFTTKINIDELEKFKNVDIKPVGLLEKIENYLNK